ncbi:MAG: pectate lyase [Nitrospirales bacterium]|nr:MAG: pectate lyase [Nitrospirales bacterium]
MQKICGLLMIILSLVICDYVQAATLAFPEAQGFGKFAKGGRGGKVIEVTNLDDKGTGSFRAALTASGPRTVVFRVSGKIVLKDRVKIKNPYITIAGQTAPGEGVVINGMVNIYTHDVIIRHLRVRVGPGKIPKPQIRDSVSIVSSGSYNIILDHVSLSWGVDETFSIWNTKKGAITIQWSIFSEALHCPSPKHPEGCHGKGVLIGGRATKISFHHNLLAHHHDRNPSITSGDIDFVNNVVYNYKIVPNIRPKTGKTRVNLVGNYILSGPSTPSAKGAIRLYDGQKYNSGSGVYCKGNIHPNYRKSNSLPEEVIAYRFGNGAKLKIVNSRYSYPSVSTTDAFKARSDVLAKAGATLPKRGTIDKRIVTNVQKKTGKIISMPSEVGGLITPGFGKPPLDIDKDGMPNSWENKYNFNPNDAGDGAKDKDGDGYTNLEEYLNKTHPKRKS